MSLKLHSPLGHGRTNKILVAAALAKVQVEFVDTQLNEKTLKEFLLKNPFGKVPVLETTEGTIFESNAILRYLGRQSQNLYGTSQFQQGLVDQWLDVTTNELEADAIAVALQVLGYTPDNEVQKKNSLAQISHTLNIVNTQLGKSKFITGETLTIADIGLGQVTTFVFTYLVGEEERNKYPNLLKWLNEVNSLPEWRAQFGRPRFLKNPFPKVQQTEVKEEKKEKKEKKQEQKPEKQKQQDQPKQKEQNKPEGDDDDQPKKKEVNPLDLLPPSTFNIDDYKRIFFAEKDIQKNIDTLFSTVDLNGWSLWLIKYNKSENEGKKLILTNNLMKGFINQRLDQNFRKYAFGIHGVYGDEPNLELRGAWLWRGTEVPKEWKDHVAYDYHQFIKVDVNNAEQKQLFVDYWIKQEEDQSVVEGLTARSLIYFR